MKKAVTSITLFLILGVISLSSLPQTQKVNAQDAQILTAPFPDVPTNHVNVQAIQYLKE